MNGGNWRNIGSLTVNSLTYIAAPCIRSDQYPGNRTGSALDDRIFSFLCCLETGTYNEKEIISRIAESDGQAFKQLVDQYGSLVYHFIRQHARDKQLAEEIVQDIFTQVWLVRDRLPEVRNFKSFLYVIARNYAINILKKLDREKKRQLSYDQQSKDVTIDPDTRNEEDWRISLIQRAVDRLPPQQKKVWILGRREGLKHAEIADMLSISKESVKKYMQWANASIIKYVEDHLTILVAILPLLKNL